MATLFSKASDWRSWYAAHAARLLLFVRHWLPERADAEDAVQSGFVKFWKHRPHPHDADVPLLYAAVRSAALDMLRSRGRRAKREEAVMLDADDCWWDADTIQERERAELMQHALAKLPEEQREVVMLRIWSEMTFAEIAETLDENINTIAARHRYALAALKKLLPEECHERS